MSEIFRSTVLLLHIDCIKSRLSRSDTQGTCILPKRKSLPEVHYKENALILILSLISKLIF